MRYVSMLLGVFLLFAFQVVAQENAGNSALMTSPEFAAVTSTASAGSAATTLGSSAISSAPMSPAFNATPAIPATPAASEPDSPQNVYGVFQNYSTQAYLGYTFFNFTQTSGTHISMNGFNASMQQYLKPWFGLDGEMFATFGSQKYPAQSFVWGGGGPRFRWSAPRGLELWAHGLVGYAVAQPRTPNGSTSAFAYELGGGVDINAHHQRWAYRIEADAVGSNFFGTYQISPKISAGIVYKF
ncbi:MAG: hypothetical protein ACRD5R_02930 [Candidatus Acidiferrales bacterium]